jgi:glutamate dehydrogenase
MSTNNNAENNQSLTLSNNYIDKVKEYGKKIQSLSSPNFPNDANFEKFAEIFYSYIPIDYLKKDKIELFSEVLKDSYSFYRLKEDKNKIEITRNTSSEEQEFLVIKLITEDKPFIVDSIKSLLGKMNLEAEFIFHPVIRTHRDKKGKIEDIVYYTADNSYQPELLIFTRVHGAFDKEVLNNLEIAIKEALVKIEKITNAWQDILAKVDNLANIVPSYKQLISDSYSQEEVENDVDEISSLLKWLKSENFTFLACLDYKLSDSEKTSSHNITSRLGITSISETNTEKYLYDVIDLSLSEENKNKIAFFGKINQFSPIHKYDNIAFVLIKHFNNQGRYTEGSIILGHYSSSLYYQSVTSIPIIRKKFNSLVSSSGFSPLSYNSAKIRAVFESLPRKELFSINKGELFNISMEILSSLNTKTLKFYAYKDITKYFLNLFMFLPSERLTPDTHEQINSYITTKFNSKILNSYYEVVAQNFKILFVTLAGEDIDLADYNLNKIKEELEAITSLWKDAFLHELSLKYGEYEALNLSKKYKNIFPREYRQSYSAATALLDIDYIRKASETLSPEFNLEIFDNNNITLKIYNAEHKLALSSIIPYLENIGFTVLEEQTFVLKESQDIKSIFLHTFNLTCNLPENADLSLLKNNIEVALSRMAQGILSNESLCRLIILAGLDWRKITVLEALTKYLQQTGFTYGNSFVQQTLIQHPRFASLLYNYFDFRFNPEKHSVKKSQEVHEHLLHYLNSVNSSNEDKVLRALSGLIDAIVRTNSFQKNPEGDFKHYVSFKFNSALVPDLPLPLPYAEIFVYSKEFEGIHLRGGKVARGGIRWSDRGEDYRTEVLGLMKAQMTKNTVIVPVGSKGAFYPKFAAENLSKTEFINKVVNSYSDFLRGLLDITDNIVHGKVQHPDNTVLYDDSDPYLVVAADKGTATFSDYANQVSQEYNFWLGDAFASGGSAGYDHKKMGITAKGGWIAVTRHFQEMGIDVQNDPITVVGIGDMSGDVFGNGMLLSKSLKLVAAFNHMHIFLDPNPDPKSSFDERKRLFALPGSKWSDYNPDLISEGGGVFERKAKSITLSPEVQNLLGIRASQVKPEELIQAILKAEVDLIWNGGIGTYIKSTQENNMDIGDKANDNLRVNGADVKAKVIGEGGNLGVSQRGRIEYSKHGGRLNTDFIDNSAGVDCSDHEVNIKIALGQAMDENRLSRAARDNLLSKMTDEVASLVLYDNFKQTQAITIAEKSHAFTTEMFARQIEQLEAEGLLDRKVEFLPSTQELAKLSTINEKLTRPELAVLLSYSKMSVYKELLETKLPQEKFFERYLLEYFPKTMVEDYKEEIISHQLRKEIIITVITNKIVNQLGGAVLSSIKRETGAHLCDIVRAFTIVTEIFEIEKLWSKVEKMDGTIDIEAQIDMFTEINKLTRRGVFWFIRNFEHPLNISKLNEEYRDQALGLSKAIYKSLSGDAINKFNNKVNYFTEHKVPQPLAHNIASLDTYVSALDVITIANKTDVKDEKVASLYFQVGSFYKFDWLRKSCDKLINTSYWNRLSLQSIKDDLYDKQRKFVRILIKQMKKEDHGFNLEDWDQINHKHSQIYFKFIQELSEHENLDFNMIVLATKKLEIFLQSL